VGAELYEPAAAEDGDPVCALSGREPVRDRDDGAAAGQDAEGSLDHGLRAGVDARRGLVQHHHRRIRQRDPGEADELALTRGEAKTTSSHLRPESVGKRLETLPGADVIECGGHIRLGRLGLCQANVVDDRAGEQVALLRHERDCAAQAVEPSVAKIDAPEPHLTAHRIVEPDQELCERGLPGSGRADERQMLARLDPQVDAVQNRHTRQIREFDALRLQRSLLGQVDGIRLLEHGDGRLQQRNDLGQRRAAGLQLVEPLSKDEHGVEDAVGVEDERGDDTLGHEAAVVEHAAGQEHRDRGHDLAEDDRGEETNVDERRPPPGVHQRPTWPQIALEDGLLAVERLHDAHAGQTLLQGGHRLGDPVADGRVGRTRVPMEVRRRKRQERHGDEAVGGERGREHDERDRRRGQEQTRRCDLDGHLANEQRERLHVRREAGDEHAGALRLEERERQPLQPLERCHA
jgi:hypothetical protein